MESLEFIGRFPAINATLNAAAAVMLVIGLVRIRQKRIDAHRKAMMSAFVLSGLFLVFYVIHYIWRAQVKGGTHTPYEGPAPAFYYLMLLSHILLAITVPVFAIVLIRLGLKRRDALHRRVARWGWPIWMYVSITGVLIYIMLYHLNPAP